MIHVPRGTTTLGSFLILCVSLFTQGDQVLENCRPSNPEWTMIFTAENQQERETGDNLRAGKFLHNYSHQHQENWTRPLSRELHHVEI